MTPCCGTGDWHSLTYARKQELFNRMLPGEPLRASGDITLSGRRLSLYGAGLEAGGNISLSSAANTDLNMRSLSDLYSEFFRTAGYLNYAAT